MSDTFEQAIECGKQSDKSEIYIAKYDKYLYKTASDREALVADTIWDKDGKTLLQLFDYRFDIDYPQNTHGKKKRFDRCVFVPYEFPFERGDIVRDIKTGKEGVLQTSRSEWEKIVQRVENSEEYDDRFCNEVVFRIVNSYNGPHLCDYKINPLHLEKITETQSNIDKDILHCIFRTMDENIVISNSLSDTEAGRKIGFWFYYGDGVPQNDEIAFKWLRFAAGNHDNEARYWIGKFYAEGGNAKRAIRECLPLPRRISSRIYPCPPRRKARRTLRRADPTCPGSPGDCRPPRWCRGRWGMLRRGWQRCCPQTSCPGCGRWRFCRFEE